MARERLQGERLFCVALSGGADSVALLLALREIEYPVTAFHLNHQLRGAEADRDEAFVRELCARLAVPLTVRHADIGQYAAGHRLGIEEAAREVRYRLLLETLPEEDRRAYAATAHTADDNLETVLFHLVRGTGARGLAGIPPVRGRIVRPLIHCTRAEIEDYLAICGQTYVTDSTNLTGENTRSRLRRDVIPVLREINPRVAEAALRLGGLLRMDEAVLDIAVRQQLTEARINGMWDIELFATPLCRRMLHRVLEDSGAPMGEIGEKHVALLEDLLYSRNPSAALSLPGGLTAVRQYEYFYLTRETDAKPLAETPLTVPFSVQLPSGRWARGEICKNTRLIHKKFNTFYVDCGTIDFESFAVRARRPGDRIRLSPAVGTKTLKRLMIERKIPRTERDRLAVFADRRGVIAAEGLGTDDSRRPCGGMVLRLCIEE